jgi:hypothetical protein
VLGRWEVAEGIGVLRLDPETDDLHAEAVASDEQNLDADVTARLEAHRALPFSGRCRKFGLRVCYGKLLGRPMNS